MMRRRSAREEEVGGTGCIQNEYPPSVEWWEKASVENSENVVYLLFHFSQRFDTASPNILRFQFFRIASRIRIPMYAYMNRFQTESLTKNQEIYECVHNATF